MIKKIAIIVGLTSYLLAGNDSAISYLQNYNKSILVKDLEKRINGFVSSVSTYIINSAGNPTINSSSQLILNFTKSTMANNVNLFKDDMQLLDGTSCPSSPINSDICSDSSGIQYTFKYDASNKIPIGLKFKPSDILGSTTLDLTNDKVIAYLNANNIVLDSSGNLIKLFNDTTISLLKQTYYIVQKNPNISFIDTTTTNASSYIGQNKVFYSPDGKGGFLIYQPIIDTTTNQAIWKVVGEPEIILTVDSTKELNGDLVVPIGEKVTVLNDNGKAIEYTMQQSSSNSNGTSNVAWNKTSGLYEKNYYFNPISISNISLGTIGSVAAAIAGTWDCHTFYYDTVVDRVMYNPIYKTKTDGVTQDLDDNGSPILIAQKLNFILGYIVHEDKQYCWDSAGHLTTDPAFNGTIAGCYYPQPIKNLYGPNSSLQRVYFEIPFDDYGSSNLVNWIGQSFDVSDSTIITNGCNDGLGGFGGGGVVNKCLIFIKAGSTGINDNNGFSSFYAKNYNYKGTGINMYKINNPGNVNTHYICHDWLGECAELKSNQITDLFSTSTLTMDLACDNDSSLPDNEKSRISYVDDNGKSTTLGLNQTIKVTITPLATGLKEMNIGAPINKKSILNNFDIRYIDSSTFGKLQCIKRNPNSNYKSIN